MRKFCLVQILGIALCLLLCSCSEGKGDVAGGITDIDHSITLAGRVVDDAGNAVAAARVVAYIDNSISVVDSIETVSDKQGKYELVVSDSVGDLVMLYAEAESLCALANPKFQENNDLQISKKKSLKGNIDGAESGYVRIKGTSLTAKISKDGSFDFAGVPSSEGLVLQYVQDDAAIASYSISTADSSDAIILPTFIEKHLSMDGGEMVYDNDSTLAENVEYVDGISGKAILLKPGQFIDLGTLDPTSGDFTISLWTKWNGVNENHQILVAQRSYWSDSTSKFQWHFDHTNGVFAVMKSAPKEPVEITFGDSSIVPVGEWCFLTLVSRDHQVSMFVNGEQVGETSEFTANQLDASVPFRIGGDEISTETWDGAIDEVQIESVARDAEWIKSAWQSGRENL